MNLPGIRFEAVEFDGGDGAEVSRPTAEGRAVILTDRASYRRWRRRCG